MKKKIIRITTVPGSLKVLLNGQLKHVSSHFEVIGVSSKGSNNQLNELSKSENIRVIPVEMTRKITPIKDTIALYNLYKLFKQEKPFIVHSHTPKAGTLAMVAAKLAKVPNRLHTIAGLPLVETKGLKRLVLNIVEKITYRCASKIYPNSFGLADIVLENHFTSKCKLKVLANGSSNGINTDHFNICHFDEMFKKSIKEKLRIKEDDFVFIFVGRLVKDKGINELIEAFNILNKAHRHVKLLLVGTYENDLDPLLPETMKIINTNSNIIVTGWVDDVRPYFAISNVLTFPSYREGFPNVVMQAGAMELSSIVTDINGCNEIIKNNDSGIIIPTKDSQALFNAMEYILTHPVEAKQMGEKSRQHIVSNYEQTIVWNAILNEYNQL
ncbi:glycosyltransferase family 4 protein [Mariniflexile gromovii]|uniref:Glycosyltransferase family 4 protein n=1 Tax=Mariniflexile gromovii TaxID=362523 RepID=A0ABS4BPG8_9FLAO|nr:glycosyltransferase family 4 protein [Mariniflexile gromovii]MBP0902478.1 glycosyltransferase family 4 protein [Mariniflexile gromovii]